MIKIYVDNVIRIKLQDIKPKLLAIIENKFTYANPQYWKVIRMGFNTNEKRYIKTYNIISDYLILSRGCITILKEILDSYNIKYRIVDNRVVCPYDNIIFTSSLYDLQKKSALELALYSQQLFIAPPAAGKTRTMIYLMSLLKQKTIIIVHTSEIFKAWYSELSNSLNKQKIGIIGFGKRNIQPITVAMIQTLMRFKKLEWEKINNNFGCVIVSECQHVPSSMFFNVINRFKAKYRYGETASKTRKDGKQFLMYDCISHRKVEITEEDMKEIKRSLFVIIYFLNCNYFKIKNNDWHFILDKLIKNKKRNELIVSEVIKDVNNDHSVLVLSDRKAHCYILDEMLKQKGINSVVMTSDVKYDDRKKIVDKINSKIIKVLIATSNLISEGANIPILSSLHLVTPSNNFELTKQRIGRIRRIVEGKKEPIVKDYVDEGNEMLLNMKKNRRKYYKKLGFDNIIDVKCF